MNRLFAAVEVAYLGWLPPPRVRITHADSTSSVLPVAFRDVAVRVVAAGGQRHFGYLAVHVVLEAVRRVIREHDGRNDPRIEVGGRRPAKLRKEGGIRLRATAQHFVRGG